MPAYHTMTNSFINISSSTSQNELILVGVLDCIFDTVSTLLKGQVRFLFLPDVLCCTASSECMVNQRLIASLLCFLFLIIQVDKRTMFDNLELILLTIDEVVSREVLLQLQLRV